MIELHRLLNSKNQEIIERKIVSFQIPFSATFQLRENKLRMLHTRKVYIFDLIEMLKKENRSFFNLCCGSGLNDSQIFTTPPKIANYKSNKEGKHSLKNISNRSSVLSMEPSPSPYAHNNKLSLFNQDSTLNCKNAPPLPIHANATSNHRNDQKKILIHNKTCNFKRNQTGTQLMHETNTKPTQTKPVQGQLQKTARKYTIIQKKPKTLPQLLLQQTKHSRGTMKPMTLGQFKESLVSVYLQNDQPPKIDESIIMVDYFHPNHRKEQEITSFLHRHR